jgi:hypothetical protein
VKYVVSMTMSVEYLRLDDDEHVVTRVDGGTAGERELVGDERVDAGGDILKSL